jgi:hypothetical protein
VTHTPKGNMKQEKPQDDWSARDFFEYASSGVVPTVDSPSPTTESEPDNVSNTMDAKDLKRHPLYAFLRGVQAGSVPTRKEMEAFDLPAASRKRLEKAVEELKTLRAAGEHGECERAYPHAAEEIVNGLPRHQRDPTYLDEPADEPSDPASLAANVQRW